MQECTQIRAAVAISFFLLSIKYIYSRDFIKFLLCSLCAIFFHVSAIMILPLYFLNPRKLHKKFWYILLVLGFILCLLKFNPFNLINNLLGGYIGNKLLSYSNMGGRANVFGIYSLSKLAILLLLFSKNKILRKNNKYSIIMLKIMALSEFFLCFFSCSTGMALRVSDFLTSVDVLLFPLIIPCIKEKKVAKVLCILLCLFWLTMRIFRNRLIFF